MTRTAAVALIACAALGSEGADAAGATVADARRLGEARAEVMATPDMTRELWRERWKEPANAFAFPKDGQCWTFACEYTVADFAAEIGFFIDVLGFGTNATGAGWAMFLSPAQGYTFCCTAATAERKATPTDGFKLSFMVADAPGVAAELARRGVVFEEPLKELSEGAGLYSGAFRTPNGIRIELWGFPPEEDAPADTK